MLNCIYCDIRKVDVSKIDDKELSEELLKLRMCLDCYKEWRNECLCTICIDTVNGFEYCLCRECECYKGIGCPSIHKACGVSCESLPFISSNRFDRLMEKA